MDKRIEHVDIKMKRSAALPAVFPPALPEGHAYRLYQPGDAAAWSFIECGAGEFDREADALRYFEKEFMPHEAELGRRMAFIVDNDGRAVATASAWFREAAGVLAPLLHWVAVIPEKQGLGLGRAISMKALSLFPGVGPEGDIRLSTQTWSHVAVGLYLRLGFRAQKEHADYDRARAVLSGAMREDAYRLFVDTAE